MTRKLAVGHCTFECGCYQQGRGFEPTEGAKEDIEVQFETSDVLVQDPPHLIAEFDDIDSDDKISDESKELKIFTTLGSAWLGFNIGTGKW
jgi:hypothetical protein